MCATNLLRYLVLSGIYGRHAGSPNCLYHNNFQSDISKAPKFFFEYFKSLWLSILFGLDDTIKKTHPYCMKSTCKVTFNPIFNRSALCAPPRVNKNNRRWPPTTLVLFCSCQGPNTCQLKKKLGSYHIQNTIYPNFKFGP